MADCLLRRRPVTSSGPAVHVYGVSQSANSGTTAMTRTDLAAGFSNPVPAINGGTGSSPFDDIYPQSEMTVIYDETAGYLVKIPKFYYKANLVPMPSSGTLGDSTDISLQIADGPKSGFSLAPVFGDRGDGEGERDYVYIAKYKSSGSQKSLPNQQRTTPSQNNACAVSTSLGKGYYEKDIQMQNAILMLYLVEFANFNSATTIGYGLPYSGTSDRTGGCDNMQYHTGTMANSRTKSAAIQYRNIENLQGQGQESIMGIYTDKNFKSYIKYNPTTFSTGPSGGTQQGTSINNTSSGMQKLASLRYKAAGTTYPDTLLFTYYSSPKQQLGYLTQGSSGSSQINAYYSPATGSSSERLDTGIMSQTSSLYNTGGTTSMAARIMYLPPNPNNS